VETNGDVLKLHLRFPTADYEDEYGACRRYLPDELTLPRSTITTMRDGIPTDELSDLLRRHVIVDLPNKYY
jgi:hypothetical protein